MAVPKIRIKGFEAEWKSDAIGNIASLSKGNGYSKSDLKSIGNPIILYGRLYTSYSSVIYQVDTFAELKEGSVLSRGNEVIIPASGETAEDISIASAVKQKEVIIGGDLNILSFEKDFDTSFMAMCITNSKTHLELSRYAQGKSVVHLRNKDISKSTIEFPNKDEQEAISSYFQSLDSLIEATDKKIATLKQTKQASLQSMFPQEGETKPRVRFKGFTDDWKKVEIGKYGDTYSGLSGKSKDDFGKGNAKYITFLNVLTNAQINTYILESVDVKTGERQNAVQKGDILFNTSSETPEEVGLCSVLLEDIPNVYLNSFCFGFRPNNPAINSEFLVYLMRGHIGRSIMKVLAQGATRYNLSKKRLCETLVPIPTNIDEQKQIAEYFSNLDKQISIQEQRLEKLKQIKSACLKNMFV